MIAPTFRVIYIELDVREAPEEMTESVPKRG